MLGDRRPVSPFLQHLIPWLMLGVLLMFTYAFFFVVPYAGFRYDNMGDVVELYVDRAPEATLQLHDHLIRIGDVLWEDFSRDFHLTLFDDIQPDDVVPLLIARDGEEKEITISWIFPGRNSAEFVQRLNSDWFVGYIFWLAGTLVMLSVRPKDLRWGLLIAFYYVTALWLVTGSGASPAHVWESANVLQSAVWLSVPIYWHLHWIIPQPLRELPRQVWWVLYGVAAIMALGTWIGLIPGRLYTYGLLLSLGGAALLLLFHLIFRPAQRKDMQFVVFMAVVTVAPLVAVSGAEIADVALPFYSAGAALLTLPLLPIAYFYTLYRRRLGGMELRRNRLLALYLFIVLLGPALIIMYTAAGSWPIFLDNRWLLGLTISLLGALITIFGYTPFQKFVERRLLGIPPAPTHLLQMYASRIATRLERHDLIKLLRDDVLPSLLVRQSALLQFDDAGRMKTLYRSEIDDADLSAHNQISSLLVKAGHYRGPEDVQQPFNWVRLALALHLGDQMIGLWLLGRRDPDDAYTHSEITVLQALADQTAIALAHIVQSDLLRAAYKADIDRMERERASLARELHDHVLGDLAKLKEEMNAHFADLAELYERITASLRQTVTGLRPATMIYGLHAALNSLVDALDERAADDVSIELDVPKTDVRYDVDLEQHLYRIVQQACENALRHAQAHKLIIHGYLEQNQLDLTIEDDGVGLETNGNLDLSGLIAHQHFGLAGMYERADLIQAKFLLHSTAGVGTRVRVIWSVDER